MRSQPFIISLVGAVVVEDGMNLLIRRNVSDQPFHECLEIWTLLGRACLRPDGAGGHVERGEEVNGPMPLVGALQASNDFATAGLSKRATHHWRFEFGMLNLV